MKKIEPDNELRGGYSVLGSHLGDLQKAQLSSLPMFRSAVCPLFLQMLSDTSPVSASAAWPGSTRLCHLVCSAVCCIRPQLESTIVSRVCRNRFVLVGGLFDCQDVQQQPFTLGAPVPPRCLPLQVHKVSLHTVPGCDRSYLHCVFFGVCVSSWKSLWKDPEIRTAISLISI